MTEKKRRIWWFDYYQIEEAESWLVDMAAQGWHLSGFKLIFAHFSPGEPEKVRYRCDIFSRKDDFSERIELYSQSGWEYVTSISSSLHVFRSPTTDAIPEIHTEPVEMAPTMNLLLRQYYVYGLIALLSVAAIISPPLAYGNIPLWLLLFADTTSIISLIVGVSIFVMLGTGVGGVLRKRSRLRRGLPLSHKKPYNRVRISKMGMFFSLILLIILFISNVVSFFGSDLYSPLPQGELPVVRISGLIPATEYVDIEPGDSEFCNCYSISSSLLVPWQWFSWEFAGQVGMEGATVYQSSLVSFGYRARTPGLAEKLAQKLAREIHLPKSDSYQGDLWLKQVGQVKEFILLKDEYVFRILYNGLEPLENLIQLEEDKIGTLQ